MPFEQLTDMFAKYLIIYADKSIQDVYNAFAGYLYTNYGLSSVPTEVLLKIAFAIRSIGKNEQQILKKFL